MSKYLNQDEMLITDQVLLVQTLQEHMKFCNGVGLEVESHIDAVHLIGYQRDTRPETAEVVIRRKYVGGVANDIGFKRQASGNFKPIISQADTYNYNTAWTDQLAQKYGELKYEQDMYQSGYVLDSRVTQQDGSIAMEFSKMGGY